MRTSVQDVFRTLFIGLPVLGIIGCSSAYYKTMESIGYHKRDLMVNRVEAARDAQQEAKDQFTTALEKFKSVTKFDGGKLETKYYQIKDEFDRSEARAQDVADRIDAVEDVADALFAEWEDELSQYGSEALRRASTKKLRVTRSKYAELLRAMRRAEQKMAPVLAAFKDQVLFLKHNLNAQAVASLQTELVSVEADVALLIKDMEASIAEADSFIATLASK